MAAKRKNNHVDSIIPPSAESEQKVAITTEVSDHAPGGVEEKFTKEESKNFVMPRKWYVWNRAPKVKNEESSLAKTSSDRKVKSKKTVKSATSPLSEEKQQKAWFRRKAEAAKEGTFRLADKNIFLKRHHKLVLVALGIILTTLVLSGLLGGAVYAHQAIYQNRVFPGVTVWGEEVGGMSTKEVRQLISRKAKEYNIVIKGPDQDYEATVDDLGIIFNSDQMALSAYSRGRSDVWWDDYFTRARLLMTEIKWDPWQEFIRSSDLAISPSYIVNQEKLTAYVTKVADNIRIQAQDSAVTVTGGVIQLKPAIYGRDVELEKLKAAVIANITALESKKIDVPTKVVEPEVVDTAAQEVMVQAQTVMSRPVVLVYKGVEYRPNQDTVGSWISFTKNPGDTRYTLVIDKEKMSSYFSFLESKINVYSIQRIVRIENGVKQTEAQAGVDGLLVDRALLGDQIVSTLPVQASVRLNIPTYVDKFKTKYENVVIADWDKYIDINLSSQIMIACEKGGVNCHQWSVTTGDDNHSTPVGTHLVLGRNASFYMTGGTPGVDYYKVWVDTAVWFTSAGHAIHDASWRNGSFGGQDFHWNGSHGCVNSPDDAATYIYNWAAVGTPVIVHY